jgi:hypothetical protein
MPKDLAGYISMVSVTLPNLRIIPMAGTFVVVGDLARESRYGEIFDNAD